jgi:hypothetical protein
MVSQDAAFRLTLSAAIVVCLGLFVGCSGRTALIPVSDPDLKKTSSEFAADAAKRTYPANVPNGGKAEALADVDYGVFNRMQISNLSDEVWSDMELWVNEKYVVALNNWPGKTLKKVNFAMLYDRDGKMFPTNNKDVRVQKIELLRGGKMYTVPSKLAD